MNPPRRAPCLFLLAALLAVAVAAQKVEAQKKKAAAEPTPSAAKTDAGLAAT